MTGKLFIQIKIVKIKFYFFILLFSVCNFSFAQEEANEKEEDHIPKIRAAIMMANSHVPHATEGGKSVSIIPTWGADIDYFFHPRWSVAFQTDIKLQTFQVEDGETLLERSYPFSTALVMHYHALRHWSFFAGPGYEFEKTENLTFFRIGTEYSFEITENFEIGLNLAYENKKEIYNAWTFGIAFNKKIWEKRD